MYTRTLVKCGMWVQLCDVYQNAREMRYVGAAVGIMLKIAALFSQYPVCYSRLYSILYRVY
jgi:hypothetical protein